jgi:hypothetical protein
MRALTHIFFILFFLFSTACSAEQLFVGIMESDSFSKMQLSLDAFCEAAGLPEFKSFFRNQLTSSAGLPEARGFELDKRVRLIQTVDPAEPLSAANPAYIAVLPIRDGGDAIKKMLEESYRKRIYWRDDINIYETPLATNLCRQVAMVQSGMFISVSPSKNALRWLCENKKLLTAPPLAQSGTLRVLINPPRLAAVLNTRDNHRLIDSFKIVDILQEFELCTGTLDMETQSLTFTIQGRPLEGSPMAILMRKLNPPDTKLLNSASKNCFLESISRCDEPELWHRFAPELQYSLLPALADLSTNSSLSGERAQYVCASPTNTGLMFVQIETLKDTLSLNKLIKSLEQPNEQNGIKLKRESAGQDDGAIRYKIAMQAVKHNSSNNPSHLQALAALLLKNAYLELRIVDKKLITVLGPKDAMQQVVAALDKPADNTQLLHEINVRNSSVSNTLMCGTKIQCSSLIRYVASTIPHITKEQLNILPEPGYGVIFALGKSANNTQLHASIQISADELFALNHIVNDSRELIQKVLISMLMKSIERGNK